MVIRSSGEKRLSRTITTTDHLSDRRIASGASLPFQVTAETRRGLREDCLMRLIKATSESSKPLSVSVIEE